MKGKKAILAMSLIAATIASMFSMLPVKADIQMSLGTQFYDPLGTVDSFSFERVGSYPCEPPPDWSVTGGMRSVATDVNRDGVVNMRDYALVSKAFGSSPGSPNWNRQCDFNNDMKIDMRDVSIWVADFGKHRVALNGLYSWDIGGAGDWYMTRSVASNCIPVLAGNSFVFQFWYLPKTLIQSDGGCRAEVFITYTDGHWSEFDGVWIVPEQGWNAVYVSAYCLSAISVYLIQVRVHLKNVAAYVDSASLTLNSAGSASEEGYGNLGVGFNVHTYRVDSLGSEIRFASSLYAQAAPGYKISHMQLKATVLPSSSDTYFHLNIPYCSQQNNKGYDVDPAAQEQMDADFLAEMVFLVPVALTGMMTFGATTISAGITAETIKQFAIETTFDGVVEFVLAPYFASDPDHPDANNGVAGRAAWEQWRYPLISTTISDFVDAAGATCKWNFDFPEPAGQHYSLYIEGSATIAEPLFDPGILSYYLQDRGTLTWGQELYIG